MALSGFGFSERDAALESYALIPFRDDRDNPVETIQLTIQYKVDGYKAWIIPSRLGRSSWFSLK